MSPMRTTNTSRRGGKSKTRKKHKYVAKKIFPKAHQVHHAVRTTFPVQKVHYIIESFCPNEVTVTADASIYLNAVLEYIAAEILENAGHQARIGDSVSGIRITESNIMEVMAVDEALNQLISAYPPDKKPAIVNSGIE